MQKDEILVSVICTAYNHEPYIRSALDGFVMQKTNFRYEVLIHDDASKDNTAQIIREYAEKYPEIIVPVLQTENQHSKGVKITNTILRPMIRGKYIALCEGDDFWTDENKLQRQVDFLEANPDYVACAHNTLVHDCSGKQQDYRYFPGEQDHDVVFEQLVCGLKNTYHTSSLMMRKEVAFDLPDYYHVSVAAYRGGDWPRAIYMSLNGKIRCLAGVMSYYRLMSNPYSWSTRHYSDVAGKIREMDGNIAMLEALKKHLTPEQIVLAEKTITDRTFTKLMLQERYDELKDPRFKGVWEEKSRTEKTKLWIKMHFTWVYHLYRRIKKWLKK